MEDSIAEEQDNFTVCHISYTFIFNYKFKLLNNQTHEFVVKIGQLVRHQNKKTNKLFMLCYLI